MAPLAYDIVIFQELGDRVAVKAESVCILRVQPDNRQLADKVLWFFGKPADEFFLMLTYATPSPPAPAPSNGFVVSCSPGVAV